MAALSPQTKKSDIDSSLREKSQETRKKSEKRTPLLPGSKANNNNKSTYDSQEQRIGFTDNLSRFK